MNPSKFQFSNPKLEEVNFIVNKSFDDKKCDGISMQSEKEIQLLNENEAYVALNVHIGEESDTQPFCIMIKMSAEFCWEESLTKEKVEKLLNYNAPAALLSYIRPLIATLTNSSGYPVLNIPFIDFTQE